MTPSGLKNYPKPAVMQCPSILNLFHIPIQHPTRRHNGQRPRLSIKAATSTDTLLRLPPRLYFCSWASPVCDVALLFRPGRVGCDVGDEGAELGQDVPELVDGGQLLDV